MIKKSHDFETTSINDITSRKKYQSSNHSNSCLYCGGTMHPRKECPASGEICRFCSIKGHFSKCCLKNNKNQNVATSSKGDNERN